MDAMTLAVVGAAYGTSIAVGLSRRPKPRRSRADLFLVLGLACAVLATLTIVVQHRLGRGELVALLERIEYVATLASGPILLAYVRAVRDGARPGLLWVAQLLPATAALLVPAALATPIGLLLAHQMAYTAAAMFDRFRFRASVVRHARLSVGVLATMAVIHLAQLVRMATRGSALMLDVVPTTLSVVLLGAGIAISLRWSSRSGRPAARRAATGPAAVASVLASRDEDSPATRTLLERLDRAMRTDHLYRSTELGLHELAAALGVTPHQLSESLNSGANLSLLDYLARYRVADARRRLSDPQHRIYTVEAIGRMSGFGSRSAFHAIFRRATGTTPARYRAGHAAPS